MNNTLILLTTGICCYVRSVDKKRKRKSVKDRKSLKKLESMKTKQKYQTHTFRRENQTFRALKV